MPTRGKQRGSGNTTGQKSNSKNKSPQKGKGRGGRRLGGNTRDQLDKLMTLREYTWSTNADKEVVISAPTRSDVERVSRQFPKGTVKFQVTEKETYEVDFAASSSDEDDLEEYHSDISDESVEDEDDILDMEEAYHEQEAQVIQQIEEFFADMPVEEQAAIEDYMKTVGMTDQDLVANIAAFGIYENAEIHDDIKQKIKLDFSPISKSRDNKNYKQRKMQKSPKSPSSFTSPPKKNNKSPKNNRASLTSKYSTPTAWVQGGLMNQQEDEQQIKEEVEEVQVKFVPQSPAREEEAEFNGQYSDSSDDEEEMMTPKKRGPDFKKKKAFTLKDLHVINHHIRDFIEEPIIYNMPFSQMSKTQRFQVSRLASFYCIKTKNVGSGKRCYMELVKTPKTKLFAMEDVTTFMEEIFLDVEVEEMNERPKKGSPGGKKGKSNAKNQNNKSPNQKKEDKYGKYSPNKKESDKPSPNAKKGSLVAQHAKPLDDKNLGSRLLKSMGWTSGTGLGPTGQGIINPIEAVIKQDRRGLGAY